MTTDNLTLANNRNALLLMGEDYVTVLASAKNSKSPGGRKTYAYLAHVSVASDLEKDDVIAVHNISKQDAPIMTAKVVQVLSYLDVDRLGGEDGSDNDIRVVLQRVNTDYSTAFKDAVEHNKAELAKARAANAAKEVREALGNQTGVSAPTAS